MANAKYCKRLRCCYYKEEEYVNVNVNGMGKGYVTIKSPDRKCMISSQPSLIMSSLYLPVECIREQEITDMKIWDALGE